MNLNQVTLPTRDMARSAKFYMGLGLTLIVDSIPRYARFELPQGGATLSLSHHDTMPAGEGIHLYFECENLDEEVERLQAQGYSFEQEPVDQDWLWREARLRDPDGHLIILYFAGENRLNPPWRVNPS